METTNNADGFARPIVRIVERFTDGFNGYGRRPIVHAELACGHGVDVPLRADVYDRTSPTGVHLALSLEANAEADAVLLEVGLSPLSPTEPR